MNNMNWLVAYPQIALLSFACVVALVDLWVTDPQRKLTYWLTQASLAVVAGMYLAFFNNGFTEYGMQRMVVADPMGNLLAFFATVAVMISLAYARPYAEGRELLKGELFTLACGVWLSCAALLPVIPIASCRAARDALAPRITLLDA